MTRRVVSIIRRWLASKGLMPWWLWLVPAGVGLAAGLLRRAAGPYWLGVNSDPAYLYLINALYLVDGITPYFTDHPGTTLEILGALVIWVMTRGHAVAEQVLRQPEVYLGVLHRLLLGMYLVSLWAVGLCAWRWSRKVFFALAVQSSALFFLTLKSYASAQAVLPVIVNINSDTLLLTVTNIYIIILLDVLFASSQARWSWRALAFGVAGAVGVTTKLTFLPLLGIPLLLLPDWRSRGIFLGTLFGVAALILMPVWSRYREILAWIDQISLERSADGAFEGIVNMTSYGRHLMWLLTNHWPLTVLMGFGGAWWAWSFGAGRTDQRFVRKVTAVFLGTFGAHFLLVARHAGPHYMAPAFGLTGVMAGWLALHPPVKQIARLWRAGWWGVLVLFVGSQAAYTADYHRKLKATNQAIERFSHQVYTSYAGRCAVFGFYRSSSVPMAIRFAQGHGNLGHYADLLRRLYPEALFYNPWHRTFRRFDKNVMLASVLGPDRCGLLYGSADQFVGSDYLRVKKIRQVYNEKLYLITRSTLDQAHRLYLLAVIKQRQGDAAAAYVLARAAARLGHPDADSLAERLRKSESSYR